MTAKAKIHTFRVNGVLHTMNAHEICKAWEINRSTFDERLRKLGNVQTVMDTFVKPLPEREQFLYGRRQ